MGSLDQAQHYFRLLLIPQNLSIINLGNGNTLSNLFYHVSRTDGIISTQNHRTQLSVLGQDEFFNDSHIGNSIRIALDLSAEPGTETRAFYVRNHLAILGDEIPNGTNYDFEMYKSKFQIANSLTDGFTNQNLQPDSWRKGPYLFQWKRQIQFLLLLKDLPFAEHIFYPTSYWVFRKQVIHLSCQPARKL